MAANLDVYMVVDKSIQAGQVVINRYFYQRNSLTAVVSANDMADQYLATVMPDVRAIQSAELVHTELEVKNLFDPADSTTRAISLPGTFADASGETLPVFNAIGITLTSGSGAVRNGAKRYGGITEVSQVDGVVFGAGIITALGDLCTTLAAPLTVGALETLFPIIVKSLLIGTDYVLPDALADLVFGSVVDAVYNAVLTSQTSRKIGVGE